MIVQNRQNNENKDHTKLYMNTNTKCINYLQLVPKPLAATVHVISGMDLSLRWYHLS